jgi:hypothetical protein
VPTAHSVFAGWTITGSGSVTTACTGTTNPCEVKLEEAEGPVSATAIFNLEKFTLTVNKEGAGTSTVESTPAGINCGATCSAEFDFGTKVKLKGTPGANTQSVVWTGCDAVNGSNECEVEITAAKAVTAKADLVKHTLEVSKEGTGSATIESTPAGINCGTECSKEFDHGTVVLLKGSPALHSKPVQWTGCDEIIGTNECKVTMTAAKSITAKSDLITHTFSATKIGNGTTRVTA